MNKDYFDIENELDGVVLLEQEANVDAMEQFQSWLEAAINEGEKTPASFVLSTSTFEGKSSSRLVNLRHIDEKGLYFLTFYESRKCRQSCAPKAIRILYFDNTVLR